ncbi:cytochrome P450 [Xylariaceae sp. FL1019]|nr:cytochrome P450 [Xylariaceae sp. FL1019]
MSFFSSQQPSAVVLTITLALVATYTVYSKLIAWMHATAIMRKEGCQDLPKYHHKDPFFGLDLFLSYKSAFEKRDFLGFNERLFQQYGKSYMAYPLGTPTIKTMNPEITKYVHATYFEHFGIEKIRTGIEYLWGDGITIVDGDKWMARRRLIKPSFDVVHISNLENRSLAGHVAKLMELIPRDGSPIDLMPLFMRLSLDTSSEFIFGQSLNSLESPESHKAFMEAYFYAQRGCGVRLILGPMLRFLHRDPKWWAACDTVNQFLDERVNEALARVKESPNAQLEKSGSQLRLIDEMARVTQDRLTLRYQMQNIFTPAHDGAAVTLSNAFFHLSRNPNAWSKLRDEILPSKYLPITYDLLKTYQYLKNVIRETHRVTPISTMISRQCIKEVVFPTGGGTDGQSPLYVPKGVTIEMNFRCTLRDKDFWGDDADVFRPERWEKLKPTWEYTPFGGGPRICPGFRLAFAEAAFTMVTILRKFARLESRDNRPWTEETRTTFQNLNGARVALFPV